MVMITDEPILKYRKPGFPKSTHDEKSFRSRIEYIGPKSDLESARPTNSAGWGNYPGRVNNTDLQPIDGTDKATLTVSMESFYEFDTGTDDKAVGDAVEETLEVEWVKFDRSFYEHEEFAPEGSGTYKLTSGDIISIQKWEQEENRTLKEAYKWQDDSDVGGGAGIVELSANAKMFARGIELGQEVWEDFIPVIRRTTNFYNGPPGESKAGLEDAAGVPKFAGGPTGYEWRKTADRAIKGDGQTRWERVEEWTGATKILSDRENLYWTPPT